MTPGWLESILRAFEDHPACGLCGPSTNSAWNEQCAFPGQGDSPADLARVASLAKQRFGNTCRPLDPLYSLSDFCYAVRRQVVEAIGEADESYGLGPCWEMDYNVRAARAGFNGLWVCGAYIYRSPFTLSRRRREAALMGSSKRRYQDKFCGLRVRGMKHDYRDHCRGDACPDFAPSALIQLRHSATESVARSATVMPEWPLVSCIMPTCNRPAFIPRSLLCFASQDYPNLELIVLDDGTSIEALLPKDPRIHYHRLAGKSPIGIKRNLACERSRGDFIIHWDDDDWYAPDRVRRQIAPLLQSRLGISGSSAMYYLTEDGGQAFRYELRGSPPKWMGGLAYRRSLWERRPFDNVQVAEDVRFLAGVPRDARLDLRDPSLSVGAIHAANTSPKITGQAGWVPEPAEKIRALMNRGSIHVPAPGDVAQQPPLVSCIMPTFNRRAFISLALASFRAQTYTAKELIVVDDGYDCIKDLVDGIPQVRYLRLRQRATIGAKRNTACEEARGDFIAHWDDDDWYSPARLASQMKPLLCGTADLTGMINSYVLELLAGQFWSASADLHRRMFVGDIHGGTIVFQKDIWQKISKYPNVNLAEDAALIQRAIHRGKRIHRVENRGEFVYIRHGKNTWQFHCGGVKPPGWRRIQGPPEFSGDTLEAYRSAASVELLARE